MLSLIGAEKAIVGRDNIGAYILKYDLPSLPPVKLYTFSFIIQNVCLIVFYTGDVSLAATLILI